MGQYSLELVLLFHEKGLFGHQKIQMTDYTCEQNEKRWLVHEIFQLILSVLGSHIPK